MTDWVSVKDRLPVAKEVVLTYESAFDSTSMAFRLPGTEEFITVDGADNVIVLIFWPLLVVTRIGIACYRIIRRLLK